MKNNWKLKCKSQFFLNVSVPKWFTPKFCEDYDHGIEITNSGKSILCSQKACAITNIVIKQNTGIFSLKLQLRGIPTQCPWCHEIHEWSLFKLPTVGFVLPTKQVKKEKFVRMWHSDEMEDEQEFCNGWKFDANKMTCH